MHACVATFAKGNGEQAVISCLNNAELINAGNTGTICRVIISYSMRDCVRGESTARLHPEVQLSHSTESPHVQSTGYVISELRARIRRCVEDIPDTEKHKRLPHL